MNSVLTVGSIALDSVQTPFGKVEGVLGGSATYFAVSAKFFAKVNLVSVIGTDFPKRYMNMLKRLGINLDGVEQKNGRSFRWKARYDYDLNSAETLSAELNIFSNFFPKIPNNFRNSRFVFLGNINPEIQGFILRQVNSTYLVACDTMNHWIEKQRNQLMHLLKKVDIFMLNDSEARELSEETNLLKAAKFLLLAGPKLIIIKKGEHGVLSFSKNFSFYTSAYLLERINDPTGAGDTFAGGFMGYLASKDRINEINIKKAVVYGSIMASFAVEDFSVNRLLEIGRRDIEKRYRAFRRLTKF